MATAMMKKQSRLMTPVEAAEYLSVKPQTLAAWRSTNRYPDLKFVRVGTHVRYRQADLDAWLESRTVGATS